MPYEKGDAKETKANVIKYNKPHKSKPDKKRTKADTLSDADEETKSAKSKFPLHKPSYVPDTNLPLACLVSLCFNLPLGLVAMYLSLTAARCYRDGDPVAGECRAKASVLISLFSIISTVLVVMSFVLWVVIEKQAVRDLQDLKT